MNRQFRSQSFPSDPVRAEAYVAALNAAAETNRETSAASAEFRRAAASKLRGLIEVRDGEPRLKGSLDETFLVVSGLLAEMNGQAS
jgi:hypothetical protein